MVGKNKKYEKIQHIFSTNWSRVYRSVRYAVTR